VTNGREPLPAEIETVLTAELRELLEMAEAKGSLARRDLVEALERQELDSSEEDALSTELERRGIDVVEADLPPTQPQPSSDETRTDALPLFLREIGKVDLLTAAQEVGLAGESSAATMAPSSSWWRRTSVSSSRSPRRTSVSSSRSPSATAGRACPSST
jgi:sigma-70-like protein